MAGDGWPDADASSSDALLMLKWGTPAPLDRLAPFLARAWTRGHVVAERNNKERDGKHCEKREAMEARTDAEGRDHLWFLKHEQERTRDE